MSENDLDRPASDLAEQRREAFGEPEEPETLLPSGADSLPQDVNEADAMEQHREVEIDEDDYR